MAVGWPDRWSPAQRSGLLAFILAGGAAAVDPLLATVPLSLFVAACVVLPFFPGIGFYLPVISRGDPARNTIYLTFDDGPAPESTPILLGLLERHDLTATFFILGEKAAQHPGLVALIREQGHGIGNHSLRHDPFLMLRRTGTIRADLGRTQRILRQMGVRTHLFRPPVGITGPRLGRVLEELNLSAVTFSCRAYDRGNRAVHGLAARILRRVRPGDIVMLHDLASRDSGCSDRCWQDELDTLFGVLSKRYRVAPLCELVQTPMPAVPDSDGSGA